MEILVVGAGAMGTWFAQSVCSTEVSISFADIHVDHAEEAVKSVQGTIESLGTNKRFDVVCIAVPMADTPEAIAEHAPKAETAIIDLSGVMGAPINAMAQHASDLERVSFHPLFAPNNAPGRIAVVLGSRGPVTDSIRERLAEQGNRLFETSPDEHDNAMKTVQSRAHTAILAFALSSDDVPTEFGTPVYDGLMALVDEVVTGNPRVYGEIQEVFEGSSDVAAAARRISDADREEFERLFADASK